jgi:hypothetical protein
LKISDNKYIGAKIGDIENKSETQIPNVFEFTSKGKKMHLIDCPGYLDTYGFYRIISNRFFHFQIFSKVQNAKFLITFTYPDMRKSADVVKDTFREFLSGFCKLDSIKKEIINATSVMITNVPRNTPIQTVKDNF